MQCSLRELPLTPTLREQSSWGQVKMQECHRAVFLHPEWQGWMAPAPLLAL